MSPFVLLITNTSAVMKAKDEVHLEFKFAVDEGKVLRLSFPFKVF
jgi:hypothetical protein